MSKRRGRPWPSMLLGALCIGAIVAAYLVVGPPSAGSTGTTTRVVTAARGVVQSTVSGSGKIGSSYQLDLGFKTSGVVERIYASQGQHVVKGQLIATLNPESAKVTLDQAEASLQADEANLTEEEEDEGETSTDGSGGASRSGTAGESSTRAGTTSEASTPKLSVAAREANIASAQAAVKSARLSVQSDEQAVKDTKLYAPGNGTIVSLSGEVGETVSAKGTTKDTSTGSSSSNDEASGLGASGASGADAGSSGSSSSSSSTFAVLSNLRSLELIVPLSQSEIGSVKKGQLATVSVEALEGRKLAAHVVQVATLPSSESGVVSYDVTFRLDQTTAGLKPGMSGTAEVVVKQAQGVNVPTEAITAGTVTVLQKNKQERVSVETGLAGDSSTIILSGLKAGQEVVLPALATSTSGASSTSSRAGRTTGGALGGAPGGGGGFPGGGAFFRGAGGP